MPGRLYKWVAGQLRSCDDISVKQQRAEGLYQEDKELPMRMSYQNPEIQKLYDEFLKEPNSHKAHELLHTHYTNKFKNSYKDLV